MKIRKQTLYFYFSVTVLLSSLSPLIINAQDRSKIDSLKTLLPNSEGSKKLKILSGLGNEYKYVDLDSALIFYEDGKQLARELKNQEREAILLKSIAQTFFFKSDYITSLEHLFSSLKIFENIDDTVGIINCNYAISLVYYTREQYDLSLKYNDIALELATKSNNQERIAAISDLIGDLYTDRDQNYEKALELYRKSYEYYNSTGNEIELSVTASKVGSTLSQLGQHDKATEFLKQSNELAKKHNIQNAIYGSMLQLGQNYYSAGKYNEAKEILELCAEKTRNEYKRFGLLSLNLLSKIDSIKGNYKSAYNNFQKYHQVYDNLMNVNSEEKLAELEAKYQNEKKQAQIDLLEKDNKIQELWRNSFIGAFAFALILAVGLYNRYRFKNRTSKELAKLNNQLEGELKQAAEYIESLLPAKITGTIKTDWKFIPSAHLGGDSFGYGFLDENHFAIYLIDVSGHGVGAALLSTSILNILKSKSLRNTDFYNPADVLNNLNQNFNMDEHDNKYFALWYGVINLSNKELVCASAFHPPAIAISNNSIAKYGNKEMMIGAFKDYNYENAYYQLSDNDSIFLFSDGCFEIETENKEFTFDDFTSLLKTASKENGKSLDYLYSLLASLKGAKEFNDDFSIINVKLN